MARDSRKPSGAPWFRDGSDPDEQLSWFAQPQVCLVPMEVWVVQLGADPMAAGCLQCPQSCTPPGFGLG